MKVRSAKHLLYSSHVAQFSEEITMAVTRMSERLTVKLQWMLCSFDGILLSVASKHILKTHTREGKGRENQDLGNKYG